MPAPLSLSKIFEVHAPELRRYVASHFHDLCHSGAEDAVCDAFLIACNDPSLLEKAWAEGGQRQVVGLLKVIAWRCARASRCRGAGAFERPHPDTSEIAGARGGAQEASAEVSLHLQAAILAAAREVSANHAEALAEALAERLLSGESDTEIARRHELPREYLNRARRGLPGQLSAR